MAAQKMKNKIPARLYIYFPDGEISKNIHFYRESIEHYMALISAA